MRHALPEDTEELAALEAELFPDNCFNAYTLRHELKFSKCWVVEAERGLAAYLLARVDGDLVDIVRVGVREEHRRQGLAYRLMTKALSLAPKATLMVEKTNGPAMRLYQDLGFKISGSLHESWLMVRAACR